MIGSLKKFLNPGINNAAQYYANVALKINLNPDGINHSLAHENLDIIAQKIIMVIGMDATHPSPGSKDTAPSIAAITTSIGGDLAQWLVHIRLQKKSKDEMINDAGTLLGMRLDLWKTHHNSRLPNNILIYRDGVSEGQYMYVILNQGDCEPLAKCTTTAANCLESF